jgi:cell division protein FtsQ
MARKSSPTISQEELYPSDDQDFAREEMDDVRLLDLEVEQESPFLRGQKRVSVRRGSIPKKTATRLKWTAIAAILIFFGTLGVGALYKYGEHSWRFRIDSSDNIDITGTHNVTHAQVMEVLGGDIGRNIFFIPLSQRKAQLEQIPWVESASIMRFVPNRLKVEISERTPVAFARIGPRISLIDAGGTLMELPSGAKKKYSFPVILGMNASEPLSTRVVRMKTYNQLIRDLDADGAHYSQDLSEVDLSDLDDVKVTATDSSGEVLVHLGSSNFLDRYKIYVSHAREWRQQFDKLDSVDLRYDQQIVVNPDLHGAVKQPPLSPAAVKAAMSAGVKPVALIHHDTVPQTTVPTKLTANVATAKVVSKPILQPAVKKKKIARTKHTAKPVAKNASASKTAPKAASGPAATTTKPGPSVIQQNSSTGNQKPSPAIAKEQDHP